MISKEQAMNAVAYLQAAASHMQYESKEHELYNTGQRIGAVNVLELFIAQHTDQQLPPIEIVYEYKLYRSDGKYMNTSVWDNKGKTYKSRGALASAIAYHIEGAINRVPHVTLADAGGDVERYRAMYRDGLKARRSKTFRATFIPEDWVVIAIPVNTKADHKHINAREWYINK